MTNLQQLLAYLKREGLKYDKGSDDSTVILRFGGKPVDCQVIVKLDDGNCLQAFTVASFEIPEGSIADIANAVHRANFGLKIGNFEFDLSDGDLRYHVALPFKGDLPEDEVLDRIILTGVAMHHRYVPAFLSVIYGNEPAEQAVALVES